MKIYHSHQVLFGDNLLKQSKFFENTIMNLRIEIIQYYFCFKNLICVKNLKY
jgi:hypothetical protein